MASHPPSASTISFRSVPVVAGMGVILVGSLSLFGWSYDIAAFTSVIPGFVSMNPVTAIAFVLSGLSL